MSRENNPDEAKSVQSALSNDADSNSTEPEPIRLFDLIFSLYGLWWFFGAAIGAPSLVLVIKTTVIDFDPKVILALVLQGYGDLRIVLSWVTQPLQEFLIRAFATWPLLLPDLRPYWVDIFAIMLTWSAAIARWVHLRLGKLQGLGVFALLFLAVGATAILFGMVDTGVGIISELLFPSIPIAILCWAGVFAQFAWAAVRLFPSTQELRNMLLVAWVPVGVFLLCLIPTLVSYYSYGMENGGAGLCSFFLMSFVVAAGAAYDSAKAGDKQSAELFVMVLGPYVGMICLLGVNLAEGVLRPFFGS